jgi:hypothetical protein
MYLYITNAVLSILDKSSLVGLSYCRRIKYCTKDKNKTTTTKISRQLSGPNWANKINYASSGWVTLFFKLGIL